MGIGVIINAIVEAITKNQDAINSLSRQVNQINGVKMAVESARSIESPLGMTLSSLSGSWSVVTTQTNNLDAFLNTINKLPNLEPTFVPVIRQTWVKLSADLGAW
ncbi:hypothetical protein EMMF5_003591 [Cystobasidiomycetes sp. EMM_F5]